ncbi:major facilitator superfamily MFS_1 [Caldivirga maquilingensis IC-167]|uniref:Major facilitator superfamily MFS_1 n=2 Tax=Caldivirga maquilingensis TaxID=76887 RepID=A8MCL3_CALMQ|nr:major facilitator superfamily MFS_1 [Caldivirga maquilingensis IC-167]
MSDGKVFMINTVSRIGYGIMVIAIPYYIPSHLAALVGVVLSAYPIAEALVSIPVGLMANRFKANYLVSIGVLVMSVSAVLFTVSNNWVTLTILHGVMGVAAALMTVPLLTLVAYRRIKLGLGYGGFFSTYFAGYIIGIGVSGLMQRLISNSVEAARVSMIIAAVTFLITLPIALMLKGERNAKAPSRPRLRRSALTLFPLWLGIMIMLGIAFTLPTGLTTHLNISGAYVALIYVSAALVLALGMMMFGALVDRIGAVRTIIIGLIGLVLIIGIAYLAVSGEISISSAIIPLAPSVLLASALVPSIYAYIGYRIEEGSEGLIMGVYNVPTAVGIAIGNLLGGFSVSHLGLGLTVTSAALVLALSMLLTALLWVIQDARSHINQPT